jgi:hypothetical protein
VAGDRHGANLAPSSEQSNPSGSAVGANRNVASVATVRHGPTAGGEVVGNGGPGGVAAGAGAGAPTLRPGAVGGVHGAAWMTMSGTTTGGGE